jgi:hypothetical protein
METDQRAGGRERERESERAREGEREHALSLLRARPISLPEA